MGARTNKSGCPTSLLKVSGMWNTSQEKVGKTIFFQLSVLLFEIIVSLASKFCICCIKNYFYTLLLIVKKRTDYPFIECFCSLVMTSYSLPILVVKFIFPQCCSPSFTGAYYLQKRNNGIYEILYPKIFDHYINEVVCIPYGPKQFAS